MSKTDKTRPWWVRIADTPLVTAVPRHDHRFGPCTLPAEITAATLGNPAPNGRCSWIGGGWHVLGCEGGSCSRERQIYRRTANRRDRHRIRRELRAHRDGD